MLVKSPRETEGTRKPLQVQAKGVMTTAVVIVAMVREVGHNYVTALEKAYSKEREKRGSRLISHWGLHCMKTCEGWHVQASLRYRTPFRELLI